MLTHYKLHIIWYKELKGLVVQLLNSVNMDDLLTVKMRIKMVQKTRIE
ncbi:MAG: hypothetical protein RIQ89_1890 [Bacteroidota bacterium]|jgi:hypothetical protein